MWKRQCNNGLQIFSTGKPQFEQTCKICHYWSVNEHLQIEKKSHPATYWKRKFLHFKIRYANLKGFNVGLSKTVNTTTTIKDFWGGLDCPTNLYTHTYKHTHTHTHTHIYIYIYSSVVRACAW